MRTLLRRRLNETTADNWQDTDLDDLLNVALHREQMEIMVIEPEAFVYIDTFDITTSPYVPKPQGFWYELEVGYKDSSAVGGYRALEKRSRSLARDLSSGSDTVYSHLGRFFQLFPTPSAAVAAGLQLLYVPTLSMASDTDVPDLHLSLHMGIVVRAQKLAVGETGDPQDPLTKELADIHALIPLAYQGSVTTADRLSIAAESLGKGY